MRSCEYVAVPVRGRTRLLTVENIQFYDVHSNKLSHYDPDLATVAEYVSITFVDQKNGHKFEVRTQQRTTDALLCPVRSWAHTIQRILSYPDTDATTSVNYFYDPSAKPGHQSRFFSQENIRVFLRETCSMYPPNHFGYSPSEIGTHSLRSGAAMALFLANEQPHKIMILGRWSSDAFLAYIRPQVQEWTTGMSTTMLQHDHYNTARPSSSRPDGNDNNKAHHDDPRIRNDPRTIRGSSNLLSLFKNGSNALSFVIPRLHIFH
jgi:hypothetical protein